MTEEKSKAPEDQNLEVDGGTAATYRPLSEADYRELWEWCLEGNRIDYLVTGNPMFVFFGYVKARQLGITPPEWILSI